MKIKELENSPYTKSEVRYWLKDDQDESQIISAGTMVPPVVGEIIHINTKMDKDWYDARWKKSQHNFFKPGVCGDFKVVSVKRYLKTFYFELERDVEAGKLGMPMSRTVEEFEVFIKPCIY